jgi:hypothetical protein
MTTTEAQKAVTSPVGEYYLRGVMETASGFKLDSDSTFEFFYSYGALDRMGQGKWTVDGNNVVLDSREKPAQDFALIRSAKTENGDITIKIIDSNTIFLRSVYCVLTGEGKTQEAMADDEGKINFKAQAIDTIKLVFEFCQEKASVFTIATKDHNEFEFRFEPWMVEVFFKDFRLKREEKKLTGPHPLLRGDLFNYEKAGRE